MQFVVAIVQHIKQIQPVSTNRLSIKIPASAIRELEDVARMDWSEGITLTELINWINTVVARFKPDGIGGDSRAGAEFTPRTFRHYQTLGCIDEPRKVGKRALYEFRHYLQGMVIRKLLWERVSSGDIALLMANRTTEQLKHLLLEGVEVIPKSSYGEDLQASKKQESWKRSSVFPGLEIHLRDDIPKPRRAELDQWLEQIRAVITASFR